MVVVTNERLHQAFDMKLLCSYAFAIPHGTCAVICSIALGCAPLLTDPIIVIVIVVAGLPYVVYFEIERKV